MDTECEACQARLAYALMSRLRCRAPVTRSGGCMRDMREAGELILCDKGMFRYTVEIEIPYPKLTLHRFGILSK